MIPDPSSVKDETSHAASDSGLPGRFRLVICEDEKGRLHVADEFYRTKQLEQEVIEQARRFVRMWSPSTFVVDPSAAALRETMRRDGLSEVAGNNDVLGGIARVQKRFTMDSDGEPMLTIDPGCTNLINELGVYEWMPGKDKPRKENDHACDALRYAMMHVDEGCGTLEVRLIGGRSTGPWKLMSGEDVW